MVPWTHGMVLRGDTGRAVRGARTAAPNRLVFLGSILLHGSTGPNARMHIGIRAGTGPTTRSTGACLAPSALRGWGCPFILRAWAPAQQRGVHSAQWSGPGNGCVWCHPFTKTAQTSDLGPVR
jgi:hypothetical protein